MSERITLLLHRGVSREELTASIASEMGPFARLSNVWQLLGYRSADAARKAAQAQRLNVRALRVPGQRGYFVRSQDLAHWLYCAHNNASDGFEPTQRR